MDYFHLSAGQDTMERLSALGLAHLGDGVYELMVRSWLCLHGKATNAGLHKAAVETLETIRYCREKGLATICGLSNISFGMPERSFVNTAFLALAIREGLTMAIANPSQELLVSCALATDLLLAKEEADLRYIEYANVVAENREKKEAALQKKLIEAAAQGGEPARVNAGIPVAPEVTDPRAAIQETDGEDEARAALRKAVMKGNRKGIAVLTKEALAKGEEPSTLLNEVLLPAINDVGDLFDKGKLDGSRKKGGCKDRDC